MPVADRGLTLERFLELPEEQPALEFMDGVVSQKVSPKGQRSILQTALWQRLDQAGWRHKRARAFTELRTSFAGASRVSISPSIAGSVSR